MDVEPDRRPLEASDPDDPDEHDELALAARSAPLRALTSISFPGVLRDTSNPNNALAALGGADAVRTTVSAVALLRDPSQGAAVFQDAPAASVNPDTVLRRSPPRPAHDVPALTLTLRPGEGSSPSNVGSANPEAHRRSFAVRVRLLPIKTEPDVVGAVDAGAGTTASANVREHSVLIGRVTHEVRFPGISDWQYVGDESLSAAQRELSRGAPRLPCDFANAPDRLALARATHKQVRSSSDAWRAADARETRTRRALALSALVRAGGAPDENVLELCRPWRFSRTAIEIGGADYAFRQHTHAGGSNGADRAAFRIGRDRRSDRDRLATLSWKASPDAVSVPAAPAAVPAAVPMRRRHAREALISALRGHFEKRPVWTRRSVLQQMSEPLRGAFAPAVRRVAYSFYGAGPFAQAWVRYAYDPRANRDARRWQVVEVRCKNPVVVEAVKLQYARIKAPLPERARMLAWGADFSLDAVPTNRNLFVQLSDIRIAAVQTLLDTEPYPDKFSPKTGFFTDEGYARVHEAIRKGLYEMARALLGEARADEILEECLRRRRRRRLQPRSVLDPKFRGHLLTPRPPRRWQNAASGAASQHSSDPPAAEEDAAAAQDAAVAPQPASEAAEHGESPRAAAGDSDEIVAVKESMGGEIDEREGVGEADEEAEVEAEEVGPLLAGTVHPKFMNFEEVEGFDIIDDDDGGDDDMEDLYDEDDEEDEEDGADAVMGDDSDDEEGGDNSGENGARKY